MMLKSHRMRVPLHTPVLVAAGVLGLCCAIAAGQSNSSPSRADQPETRPERSDQVDLRPRFLPGQTTRYEMQVNSRSQLSSKELPELDQKQLMKQTLRLSLKVIEAGSDGATLELVYDAAKISFENDDFSAEYDSAKAPPTGPATTKPADPLDLADPSKMLESLVKGMVGAKMTLKTDAAGNIVSMTGDGGVSGMSKSFMNSVGGSVPGLSGALPSGGDAAKWIINGPRPSGMARVGESWTNEDSLGGTPLGEFKMKTTHTLNSHRGGLASLKFTGKAEASSAGTPSPTGFQLQLMTNDGTYQWDTERGSLAKMDADMRVGIESTLTGAASGTVSVIGPQTWFRARVPPRIPKPDTRRFDKTSCRRGLRREGGLFR